MEEEYELQSELRTGIPFRHKKKKNCFFTYGNPNKGFANNNVRDYDKEQIALLENLENEIIERLNSPELFTEGITVIDHSGSKYKKKHKKKDLTRLMI